MSRRNGNIMPDNHMAEFNDKILNIILCNKVFLRKWEQDTHSQCIICHITESSKYLIFECENVTEIWNASSMFLKTNIKRKHVIVCFDYKSNRKVITLNSLMILLQWLLLKIKDCYSWYNDLLTKEWGQADVSYHSRCGSLNHHSSKIISATHRSKYAIFHRRLFQMSETFSTGTTNKQTNKQTKIQIIYWYL